MSPAPTRPAIRRHHLGPVWTPVYAGVLAVIAAVATVMTGIPDWVPLAAGLTAAVLEHQIMAWRGQEQRADRRTVTFRSTYWVTAGAWAAATAVFGRHLTPDLLFLAAVIAGVVIAPAVARVD